MQYKINLFDKYNRLEDEDEMWERDPDSITEPLQTDGHDNLEETSSDTAKLYTFVRNNVKIDLEKEVANILTTKLPDSLSKDYGIDIEFISALQTEQAKFTKQSKDTTLIEDVINNLEYKAVNDKYRETIKELMEDKEVAKIVFKELVNKGIINFFKEVG